MGEKGEKKKKIEIKEERVNGWWVWRERVNWGMLKAWLSGGRRGKKGKRKKRETSFMFLLSGALVMFGLSGMFWSTLSPTLPEEVNILDSEVVEEPRKSRVSPAPAPDVSALSGVVWEVNSDTWLWTKAAWEPRLPASTTKIMTGLVVLEAIGQGKMGWEQVVVVPEAAARVDGHKMGLGVGEAIMVKDLVYGLLLASGNDAAEALAATYPGGRGAMVAAMNEKAKELGLKRTHFTNPVGYDEYLHFSTAEDLARLAKGAMEKARFAQIVGTFEATVGSTDGSIKHEVRNLNELLGEVSGVKGVKTGWTEEAGENLVTVVERNGEEVIVVVLSSKDRFSDTRKLVEWAFKVI